LQIAAKQLQLAHGYYRQPIGTNQRPIQRYHRRPSTTYRLATIQNVTDRQTTDGQSHRTSYHKRPKAPPYYGTQYGRLKIQSRLSNVEVTVERREVLANFLLDLSIFSTTSSN